MTYTYDSKRYNVGDEYVTTTGTKYKVVKILGWASFRGDISGRKLIQYQLEYVGE